MTAPPRVAIVYGSAADKGSMAQCGAILSRFGVPYDEVTLSPHRAPRAFADWLAELEPRGVELVVCGSGAGAALAGLVAANTVLPVVGVPLKTGLLDGLDALLAMTLLPTGTAVATVGVDKSLDAAVLAITILSVGDPDLRAQLWTFKDDLEKAATAVSEG